MKVFEKKMNVALAVLVVLSISLNGCLKRSDVTPPEAKTFLSIMHLAPVANSVEVFFNNSKVTNPITAGSYLASYGSFTPGLLDVKFKKTGSDSLIAIIPTSSYDSLEFYTLVLYNDPQPPATAKALKIYDDFTTMQADKSSYRFFNMSPDAGSVDFYIENDKLSAGRTNADIATNEYYTLFQKNTPGSYTIKAKLAGSDSVIAQVATQFSAANAYTVFLKGVSNGTGDNALKLVVLRAAN